MAHDLTSIISIIKHIILVEQIDGPQKARSGERGLASPPVEVWKCLFASAPCDGGRGYS
jgi:hypothetical protein